MENDYIRGIALAWWNAIRNLKLEIRNNGARTRLSQTDPAARPEDCLDPMRG